MQQPLISIIVPVFNASFYLERCLTSIQKQTYPSIEVILVDDGSTDYSGDICRKFAKADSRIKLITQANGGRSAARNTGLAHAQGTFLGFVDSDDWVEEDMFETLYKAHLETKADIVQCSYYYHSIDDKVHDMSLKEKEYLLTTDEALEMLFRDKEMKNFLWNKLFVRSLFHDITFPLRVNFEDMAVLYRVFANARTVACLPVAKYHYMVSLTSISHARFSDGDKFDYLKALYAQYQYARSVGLWKKSSVVLAKKYLSIIDEFLEHDVDEDCTELLVRYLKENVNGWELLRYSPYRAFRRFLCVYCGSVYRGITRMLKNSRY